MRSLEYLWPPYRLRVTTGDLTLTVVRDDDLPELVARFQGAGVGVPMRRTICALAFDHLGAEEVTSAAFPDNPASLAVSAKAGYHPTAWSAWSDAAGSR